MAIEQQGAQPLSRQIRDDLVKRIRTGEFTVGQKIPSLRTLRATYDVAELTVHAAVRELQQAGVLESGAGRGTFVVRVPDTDEFSQGDVANLRSEVADLRRRVEVLESKHES